MKKSINYLIIGVIWAFYVSLIYTGFNPNNLELVELVDNASVFYLILHTPLNIILFVLSLFLIFSKDSVVEETLKKLENKGELKSNLKHKKEMNSFKNKTIMSIGSLLVLLSILSCIQQGFFFLGTIMIMGFFASRIIISFARDFLNAIEKRAKELDNESV